MFDKKEIHRMRVAVKLADNIHLSVPEVIDLLKCDKDYAYLIMHDLTLIGVASWNPIDGRIDYNFFWNEDE